MTLKSSEQHRPRPAWLAEWTSYFLFFFILNSLFVRHGFMTQVLIKHPRYGLFMHDFQLFSFLFNHLPSRFCFFVFHCCSAASAALLFCQFLRRVFSPSAAVSLLFNHCGHPWVRASANIPTNELVYDNDQVTRYTCFAVRTTYNPWNVPLCPEMEELF